jgi:hypothetical protein
MDQPRTQEAVDRLLRGLWVKVGGHPADFAFMKPQHGSWSNALAYLVVRNDHKSVSVPRTLLDDDGRIHEIEEILKVLVKKP